MDESLISRIFHAASSGRLTEEQYQLYLRLLDEDPDFREAERWEEFIDKYLSENADSELYEAAAKIKLSEKKAFVWSPYPVAAGIGVLLLAGWFVFQNTFQDKQEKLLVARFFDLYSGDVPAQGQLAYAEGDLPIAEQAVQLWHVHDQKERISYQLCSDTLRLYFSQIEDTTGFDVKYRLTYFSNDQSYYLVSGKKQLLKLTSCTANPQVLVR